VTLTPTVSAARGFSPDRAHPQTPPGAKERDVDDDDPEDRHVHQDVLIEEDRTDYRDVGKERDRPHRKWKGAVEVLVHVQHLGRDELRDSRAEGHDHNADDYLVRLVAQRHDREDPAEQRSEDARDEDPEEQRDSCAVHRARDHDR
jgi:hypothetical protein